MVTQNTNLPNLTNLPKFPNLANLPNKISLGSINADYLTASRHTQRETQKKERNFRSSLQYPEPGSKCEALARTP